MIGHNRADTAVKCSTKTSPLSGYNQMQIDCAGMWGGVSGGPWFSKLNSDGTGEIIGNVGGWNGGGIDKNDPRYPRMYDRITYSPMHQDYFFRLYDDAQHGRHPDYGKYRQPRLPYTMGGAGTWKHAKLMASGDFTGRGRSDMVVVWTDGEVTLYNSDGRGGFSGERQLLGKNATWKHAEGITAGDFTGSSQFDLIVRWSDGEVSLYGDVGAKGLNWNGITMVDKNKEKDKAQTWKHATQITAGRFIAAKYVTDLIVRWSDGELTLYTNVGAEKKFSEEHKLKDSNKPW
ncbi:FG-GAP-like repeat-containing protein [Streptomyces sp. URMC 126]|uniref:FG-GAP-like repeat-containing protein n=1 Tax=Streptomyces sp. URMC 126 TaxID=3423401 RepID=UPI003F1CEAD7